MIASAPDRHACFLSSGIADSRSPWEKPVLSMCTSNRETRSKAFCGTESLRTATLQSSGRGACAWPSAVKRLCVVAQETSSVPRKTIADVETVRWTGTRRVDDLDTRLLRLPQ